MKNTSINSDQPKNRKADQDIGSGGNHDVTETSGPRDTPTQSQMTARSKADKLEDRLIDFAVRIISLAASLPQDSSGKAHRRPDPEVWNLASSELWRSERR
jgi:hypothetical protein